MKVLPTTKLSKDSIHLEFSVQELRLVQSALRREQEALNNEWEKCEPSTPEELIYRVTSKDTVFDVRNQIGKILGGV